MKNQPKKIKELSEMQKSSQVKSSGKTNQHDFWRKSKKMDESN